MGAIKGLILGFTEQVVRGIKGTQGDLPCGGFGSNAITGVVVAKGPALIALGDGVEVFAFVVIANAELFRAINACEARVGVVMINPSLPQPIGDTGLSGRIRVGCGSAFPVEGARDSILGVVLQVQCGAIGLTNAADELGVTGVIIGGPIGFSIA